MEKIIFDATNNPITGDALMRFNNEISNGNIGKYDIRLSEHFMLSEFVKTRFYQRYNYITHIAVANNLQLGVRHILEPLRKYVAKPIIISSGFRTLITNAAVGGKPKSQHTKGCAADIKFNPELSPADYILMRDYIRNSLPFDQLLTSDKGHWLHVSWTKEPYCAGGRHQAIYGYYD